MLDRLILVVVGTCLGLQGAMFISCSATSVSASTDRLAQEGSDSLVTGVVSPAGGSIVLEGFATVVFPAGAFEEPHSVTVSATQSQDMRALLEAFTADTLPIRPMLHEVRVNTGDLAPAGEVEVAVVVSEEFLGRLPGGHVPWAYVLLLSGGPLETLDNFWPFPNEWEPATRELRVILGRSAFGDTERRPDGALEAVIMVGAVRDVASVTQQAADSVATGVIPPQGGTVELAGFATVIFPVGAFDALREVTLEATAEEYEREIFEMDYRMPPAAHEIRVLTGETPPGTGIEVVLNVPDEFLSGLRSERTPDLYARIVSGGAGEFHDKYLRLPSVFDAEAKTVRADVPKVVFEEYRVGRGIEAVIMIGSRLKR